MKLLIVSLLIISPLNDSSLKVVGPPYIEFNYYEGKTLQDLVNCFQIEGTYNSFYFNKIPRLNTPHTADYILHLENNVESIEHPFTLKINDPLPPKITGPLNFNLSSSSLPSVLSLLNYYVANDEVDGETKISLDSTSYSPKNNEGQYYIEVYSKDKANNVAKYRSTINISKNNYDYLIPPFEITKYLDDHFNAKDLVLEAMKQHLIEEFYFIDAEFISYPSDMYLKTGRYEVNIKIKLPQNTLNIRCIINMLNDVENHDSKIYLFFKSILDWLNDKIPFFNFVKFP